MGELRAVLTLPRLFDPVPVARRRRAPSAAAIEGRQTDSLQGASERRCRSILVVLGANRQLTHSPVFALVAPGRRSYRGVAHFFLRDRGGFIGRSGALSRGRGPRLLPAPRRFVFFSPIFALYAARRVGVAVFWAPTGLGVIFLIATIAIGSGLVVNLGLKDHAHRPRPVHVVEFGGTDEFRPWYRFDGACKINCSFVSGEAATGFWMAAPALLLPPPVRAPPSPSRSSSASARACCASPSAAISCRTCCSAASSRCGSSPSRVACCGRAATPRGLRAGRVRL